MKFSLLLGCFVTFPRLKEKTWESTLAIMIDVGSFGFCELSELSKDTRQPGAVIVLFRNDRRSIRVPHLLIVA
jgi:hypothetical protein